jgi:hypothetical protein
MCGFSFFKFQGSAIGIGKSVLFETGGILGVALDGNSIRATVLENMPTFVCCADSRPKALADNSGVGQCASRIFCARLFLSNESHATGGFVNAR